MTKATLIHIAHEAQHDAGSLPVFSEKVMKYLHTDFSHKADPVAAFLGALIAIDDNADKAIEHIEFYFAELQRAKEELIKSVPTEDNQTI